MTGDDMVMSQLVEDFRKNKRLKRLCKSSTVFRLHEDPVDAYRTLAISWEDPRALQYLEKKYGTDFVVLNGTLEDK